jgi:hypothetical protein
MNIDSIAWFQFTTGVLSGYTVFTAIKYCYNCSIQLIDNRRKLHAANVRINELKEIIVSITYANISSD